MNQINIQIPGYTIIRKIGSGGMSEVYLAKQDSLKREVAIKVLQNRSYGDPKIIHRFLHEAETIAKLYHPNIVSIYEVGQLADDVIFYSMPYLPNGDLTDFQYENNNQLISLILSISEGLNYAHQQGVIHRDIKPENILFDQFGQVQIADFGIAISESSKRLTKEDHIVGSATYMSPEQARSKPVDARTDIYSLGVVLYELLAGKPPFKKSDDLATLMAHVNDPAPKLPENVSQWQEFIDRCLAKNPDDRYQDISSLQHAMTTLHKKSVNDSSDTNITTQNSHHQTLLIIPVIGILALFVYLVTKSPEENLTDDDFFTTEKRNSADPVVTVPQLETLIKPEISLVEADRLIIEAAERVEQYKLTSPKDDNALDRYLKVLKSYPEHEPAQQGIYAISLKYFELISNKIASRQYTSASKVVDTVLSTWGKAGLSRDHFSGEISLLLNTINVQFNKESKKLRKNNAEMIFNIAEKLIDNNRTLDNLKNQLDKIPNEATVLNAPYDISVVVIPATLSNDEPSHYNGPDFAMTRNEITRKQYEIFAKETNRKNSKCKSMASKSLSFSAKNWQKPGIPQQDNHPVVCVTWQDAQAYATWLSQKTGHQYRLPSKNEIQHAKKILFINNPSDCVKDNIAGVESRDMAIYGKPYKCDDNYRYTSPVGRFSGNRLGIKELFGNVKEWTVNCSISDDNNNLLDKIIRSNACDRRFVAGKSWRDGQSPAQTDKDEIYLKSNYGYTHVGIRLVRQID